MQLTQGRRQAPARPRRPHPTELEAGFARFLAGLCGEGRLNIGRYRPAVLQRRQAACLRALRTATIEEAAAKLASAPAIADTVLSSLLVGVTEFFREPAVFEDLVERLPKLAGDRRGIRVLSVGCSDGSELYSVAMLLSEAGLLGESTLVGVDCRAGALRAAAEGVYAASALKNISDTRLQRHFVRWRNHRDRMQVSSELRSACRWVNCDAFKLDAGLRADLVVCRNLAIYLRPEAAGELWTSLAGRLEADGLLMVGKAERPTAPCTESGQGGDGGGACSPPSSRFIRVAPCLYRLEGA